MPSSNSWHFCIFVTLKNLARSWPLKFYEVRLITCLEEEGDVVVADHNLDDVIRRDLLQRLGRNRTVLIAVVGTVLDPKHQFQ